MADSPSIALVVMDTLRKDSFDDHFGWLIDQGVGFDNAWSTSHWTVPAHASLFTGQYASEVGTHAKNRHLEEDYPAIAELLSAEGYRTRGVTANSSIDPRLGYGRGFDYYNSIHGFEWADLINNNIDTPFRYLDFIKNAVLSSGSTSQILVEGYKHKMQDSDDSGANEILSIVDGLDFSGSEFLFVNLMEAHSPYCPPDDYQTVDEARLSGITGTALGGPEMEADHIKTAYRDSVQYLSDKYQEIHNQLLDDFDYIITLSDHGEAFGEHDCWGHTCVLPPEITHIPLVVSGKHGSKISTTENPVSLLDIYQTICDLADIEPPESTWGEPLTNQVSKRETLIESHGLTKREQEKLVRKGASDETITVFDEQRFGIATTNGYAFETHQGEVENIGEISNQLDQIQSIRSELDEKIVKDARTDVPSDIEDRLKHLGYA